MNKQNCTVLAACLLALSTGSVPSASAQTSRVASQQPFAQTSIWNMPLGSNAAYVPANLAAPPWVGVDIERFFSTQASDPLRPSYDPFGGDKLPDVCSGTSEIFGAYSLRLPDNLVVGNDRGNRCTAVIKPDGRTVVNYAYFTRCTAGGPVYGWRWPDLDLYNSPGIQGGHGGSGLSSIGGSIRKGEIIGTAPIRHALKLNVPASKVLYYSAANPTSGHRWPADRQDSYAGRSDYGYKGSNPKLVMGTLLAIPPSETVASLGLVTDAAKKLFYALQNYGAYVTDDTAGDSYDFPVEDGVPEEFSAAYGYNMWGNSTSNSYFVDCQKLIQKLAIIDNNGPNSIGGGGYPRAPLALPFATTVADGQAPAAPTGLVSSAKTNTSVTLKWYPAKDNIGVSQYEVYSGSTKVATISGTTTTGTVSSLTAGTTYSFTVRAKDQAGNVSAASASVTVSLAGGPAAVATGTYQLVARHSQQALDVSGASLAEGAPVLQWPVKASAEAANQYWQVRAAGSEGYYLLVAQHSGHALALDLDTDTNGGFSDPTANGVRIEQAGSDQADRRLWRIEATSDGYVKLTNKRSGKVLEVGGGPTATGQGAAVRSWEYVAGTNQQWKLQLVTMSTSSAATSRRTAPQQTARTAMNLEVFPNPTTGNFTVKYEATTAQEATVTVTDGLGRLVHEQPVALRAGHNRIAVRLSPLPAGLYRLSLSTADSQSHGLTVQLAH